jgi:D-hydroxyproline dehydrogenase subunit beta
VSAAPDAIVVGAGVVGAAVAWHLAADGLRVEVLDSAFPGGSTTAGAMGHVVVMADSPAQLALTSWSRALLAGLAPALPPAVEHDDCGTLWIAEDDAQLEAAAAKARCLAQHGIRAELLDARALGDAEPELRPGLAGALLVPDDVVVYPPALCRWLLGRAMDHGARVRTGVHVERIVPHGVELGGGGGRVNAAIVVNAAGAAASRLTPSLEVIPRKGHLVITDRAPGFCRHQLAELGYLKSAHAMDAASVAFNVQPRTTGQLLVGSSRELVGWDARINRDVLGRMLQRASSFLPRLQALTAVRAWTAFRPATRDKLPYIGCLDAAGGTWVAAGHEGLGITTALGTGRMIADLVADRAPAIDPAPFCPRRGAAA